MARHRPCVGAALSESKLGAYNPPVRSVAILIVGDEILSGEITDENGPHLIQRLARDGVHVVSQSVVRDGVGEIVEEIERLRRCADAVIISGGLGPTHDDMTRPAVAQAMGVGLERHQRADLRIRGFYKEKVTDAELSMAMFPEGARIVDGVKTGTFGFEIGGVYALPGVPFLFRDLIEGIALEFHPEPVHRTEVKTTLREGEIAPQLTEMSERIDDVAIGSYPVCEDGCWHVRLVVRGTDEGRVNEVAEELKDTLA